MDPVSSHPKSQRDDGVFGGGTGSFPSHAPPPSHWSLGDGEESEELHRRLRNYRTSRAAAPLCMRPMFDALMETLQRRLSDRE